MEFRSLGTSELKVPVLSFGTGTFGGSTSHSKKWGGTQLAEARRMIDICLDHGINLFDTADVYSAGLAEEILGQALKGRRAKALISTKTGFPNNPGDKEFGASRARLIEACDASLRRLQTDTIDIYHLHGFDAVTPVEETLETLNELVKSGKIRAIACSNFSGWHLMKSLAVSDRKGWARHCAYQAYYSLIGRDFEWELMPLCLDQKVGTIVWSPLAGGALTGKFRRDQPPPPLSRVAQGSSIPYDRENLFKIVDVLDEIAEETGKTISQVALNWLLQRPTISSLVIGARNEEQLQQNMGAIDWSLSPRHVERLNEISAVQPAYPYWHQRQFPMLMPPIV